MLMSLTSLHSGRRSATEDRATREHQDDCEKDHKQPPSKHPHTHPPTLTPSMHTARLKLKEQAPCIDIFAAAGAMMQESASVLEYCSVEDAKELIELLLHCRSVSWAPRVKTT